MKLFSIRFKVVFTIILVLLATVSISIFLTVSNQQNSLLAAMRNNLTVNNGILNTVIKNIMLSGEAPIANKSRITSSLLPSIACTKHVFPSVYCHSVSAPCFDKKINIAFMSSSLCCN